MLQIDVDNQRNGTTEYWKETEKRILTRVQVTPAQLGLEVVPFRASTSFLDTGGIGERRGTLHVLGARFQDFSSGWETSVLPCRDHGFRGTIARVFLVAHSTVHVRAFLGLRAATAKICNRNRFGFELRRRRLLNKGAQVGPFNSGLS